METCDACRDTFPCLTPCIHADCITQRAVLGILERPHPVGYLCMDQDGTILIDTTPDDPIEWTWPENGGAP